MTVPTGTVSMFESTPHTLHAVPRLVRVRVLHLLTGHGHLQTHIQRIDEFLRNDEGTDGLHAVPSLLDEPVLAES